MMNYYIIKHIFDFAGVSQQIKSPLINDEFLLDKNLAVELDNGEKIIQNVYGSQISINSDILKIIVIKDSVENEQKYIMICQFNDLTVYALVLSDEENTKSYFAYDAEKTKWAYLGTLLLAKLLVGIEQIREFPLVFTKLKNFEPMYNNLLNFLNYEEEHTEQKTDNL